MTTPTPGGAPVVVLAVESATVQRVLGSVLARAGYTVTSVGDGISAVQAATVGPADALVAWAALPRLSGYTVTRLLREDRRTGHLPVLLLTAPGAAAERYWAIRCGANRALPTDVEAHELTAAVGAELVAAQQPPERGSGHGLRDLDDTVLVRATEVLERALFETALVAEVTGFAVSGTGREGGIAGLLSTVARVADPALAAVVTPDPPLALVAVGAPVSRRHYRDLLLRVAADVSAVTGSPLDAGALDARAADPGALLGADEEGHLASYHSVAMSGADGRYVGQLALTSCQPDGFSQRVLRTVSLLAEPAGRLVGTLARARS